MAQNLRAYFIIYVITSKWTVRVDEKFDLPGMSQRPRLSSAKTSDLSLAAKVNQQQKTAKNSEGSQKIGTLLPRGGIFRPFPPMSTGLVLRR